MENSTHTSSASSSIGFDWLRPLLRLGDWNFGQGHDHELRNPVSLDSLEKHQKSIRNASEKHQKSIRKGSLRCLNIHEITQPRIQLPFHYTEQNMFSLENFRVCGKFGIAAISLRVKVINTKHTCAGAGKLASHLGVAPRRRTLASHLLVF